MVASVGGATRPVAHVNLFQDELENLGHVSGTDEFNLMPTQG